MVISFTIDSVRQILFRPSSVGRWGGQSILHAREKWAMCRKMM